jgi:hypothetical protein
MTSRVLSLLKLLEKASPFPNSPLDLSSAKPTFAGFALGDPQGIPTSKELGFSLMMLSHFKAPTRLAFLTNCHPPPL